MLTDKWEIPKKKWTLAHRQNILVISLCVKWYKNIGYMLFICHTFSRLIKWRVRWYHLENVFAYRQGWISCNIILMEFLLMCTTSGFILKIHIWSSSAKYYVPLLNEIFPSRMNAKYTAWLFLPRDNEWFDLECA